MTSRKFFFKLMAEDLKDRIWSIALAVFVFFLSMPVFFMLGANSNNISRIISQTVGDTSVLLPVITVVGSVICAVNGFHYLNSRAKVDYWHSLPVRREVLFAAKYINGVLIYLFAYLLNLMITLVIFAADGHLTKAVFTNAYMSLLTNFAAYLLFYALALVAVFLTGHTLVTLMGILVFYFYGPCVNMLTYYLKEEFFYTLYTSSHSSEFFGPPWCSPINAYVQMVNHPPFLFQVFLADILLFVLALFLYTRRPSEAAGTAMAFYISQPLFKFALLIPLTLGGGMFFMKVSNVESIAWFLFGMILSWLAGSIFAEVVYALDFRRALSHKGTSLACLAAAICIFTIFRMDLFGYDRWIPAKENLAEISISFNSLDRGISTFELNLDPNSSAYNRYNYVGTASYRLNNMVLKGEDLTHAYSFAKAGAGFVKEQRRTSKASYETELAEKPSLYFDVKYTLNSGKTVYRSYHIYMDWKEEESYLKEAIDKLYASKAYKEGCYPILNPALQTVPFTGITLYDDENQPRRRNLTEEQMSELLDTFREELLNISLEATATDRIMGALCFNDNDEIYGRNGEYPVYESYTETIRLLKSYGISGFYVPDIKTLTQVEVVPENCYSNNGSILPEAKAEMHTRDKYSENGIVFTDPKEMEEILSCVTYMNGNASFYHLYSKEAMYRVYALRKNEYNELEVLGRYYLMEKDAPECIKEK